MHSLQPPPALDRHEQARELRKQKFGLKAGLVTMHENAKKYVTGLLPTLLLGALWLVMENMPGSKFPSLIQLLKCLKVIPESDIVPKFTHPRYFWSCLFALSEILLCSQLTAIRASPFFSIMMDSSTDVTSESHVLIYVQY